MYQYWSFAVLLFVCVASQDCDRCYFTDDDPADCSVYGSMDGELVIWSKASEACLDSRDIAVTGVDPATVGCSGGGSVNSFVNAIKFETIPNSVRAGLGVSEGGFFEIGPGSTFHALKESITVNGKSFNCDAPESDCYNAMKDYFASGSGAKEMQDVCSTFINAVLKDRELQQSTVRINLCNAVRDSSEMVADCKPLVSEVKEKADALTTKACSAFGFGPEVAGLSIPNCPDDVAGAPSSAGGNGVNSSAGSKGAIYSGMYALVVW